MLHADANEDNLAWISSSFKNALRSGRKGISEYKRIAGLILHRSQTAIVEFTVSLLKCLVLLSRQAKEDLNTEGIFAVKRFIFLERTTAVRLWGAKNLSKEIVEGV